jgi:predicted permease
MDLLYDLYYGMRMLIQSPGFTLVALLSLSLGIGANTTVFSLVNGVLLKTLPVRKASELRTLNWIGDPLKVTTSGSTFNNTPDGRQLRSNAFSYQAYTEFRERATGVASVFAFSLLPRLSLLAHDEARSVDGLMVSGNFFEGLGLDVLKGRTLLPADDQPGADPAAVISYTCWRDHFGQDPNVLGQRIALDGNSFTLVGVLPEGFAGVLSHSRSDVYVPLSAQPQLARDFPLKSPENWVIQIMARLQPNADEQQLRAGLEVLFSQTIGDELYCNVPHIPPHVLLEDGSRGLYAAYQDTTEKTVMMLMAVVGTILLIACANIAGLLLARGAARQHELAVRMALGAGRGRLIRQLLTESMLIALIGTGCGLLLTAWGNTVLFRLLWPARNPLELQIDGRVLAFTLVVSGVTVLLFGLIPALSATQTSPMSSLKDRSSLGSPRLRLGKGLVSIQVALTLILLIGAGLFTRTLLNLYQVETGFNPKNLLVFGLDASKSGHQGSQLSDFYERARASIAELPGVQDVAYSNISLLSGWTNDGRGVHVAGRSDPTLEKMHVLFLNVSDSFLSTLGIPLISGRTFGMADNAGSSKVVMVNKAFAQAAFPNENPIGQIVTLDGDFQIVGICGDITYASLKRPIEPTLYFPYCQRGGGRVYFEVRTTLDPMALVPPVRKVVAGLDRHIPLDGIKTQAVQLNESIAQERLFTILCGGLALLALQLSCIGLYGLQSYNVAQRTREIGIRMALGAMPGDVVRPILREALVLTGAGVAVGLPVALALTRILRGNLYGIEPHDPATLIGAVALLLAIGAAAAWFPARRAAKIDPLSALRTE